MACQNFRNDINCRCISASSPENFPFKHGDEFGCIRIPGQILFELPRDNVIFKVTINLNGRIGPKEINSFLKKEKYS